MDELYFWIYKGLKKIRKEGDLEFDAFLGVLFFIIIYIIIIGRIFNVMIGFKLLKADAILIGVILAISLIFYGYFFLYKRRSEIFAKMRLLSNTKLKKGKKIFICYVIMSLVMFYGVLLFL